MMQSLRAFCSRFCIDNRGISTIEFVLILPVALLMYALLVVMSEGLIIKQDVVTTAKTITDLVAQTDQSGQLSTATLDCTLGVAAAVMTPWSSSNLSIVVSELLINPDGSGTVVWSRAAYNGVARTAGSILPATGSLFTPGSYQLYGETSYAYKPMAVYIPSLGTITLSEAIFNTPRNAGSIILTSP